jgi:hypothetical protein
VCDNCYADLHPAISVTVRFFCSRLGGSREPFAVIRERTRSDHKFPDIGQQLAWLQRGLGHGQPAAQLRKLPYRLAAFASPVFHATIIAGPRVTQAYACG